MVPSHTVHLPLGALLSACTMCGHRFCAQLHELHAKSKVFGAPKIGKGETRTKDEFFLVRHCLLLSVTVCYCLDCEQ